MSCFYCQEPKGLRLCPLCRRVRACSESHLALHRKPQQLGASNSACSSRGSSRSNSQSRVSVAAARTLNQTRCFPFKIVRTAEKVSLKV